MPRIVKYIEAAVRNGAMRYETQTDVLSPFGFPKGTQIDFVLFDHRNFRPGVYLVWLKGTTRYFVRRVGLSHFYGTIILGGETFPWSAVQLVGEYRHASKKAAAALRKSGALLNTVAALFLICEMIAGLVI